MPDTKTTIRLVVLLLVTAAGAAAFFLLADLDTVRLLAHVDILLDNGETLRAKILEYGAAAPLVFIGLQVLQILLAPMPGEATGILGGYLFGVWAGFWYSTIGLALGSWIAFAIGRLFADLIGPRLQRMKGYEQFDRLVHRNDFAWSFVFFLLPGLPKDIFSYVLGMSRMPLPVFLFISAVGRMPGTLLLSLNGAKVYERDFAELGLLLLLCAVIFVPCYLLRRRLLGRYASPPPGMKRREEKDGLGG